jgi:hypothetical protein
MLNEYERYAISLSVLLAGWLLAKYEQTAVAILMKIACAAFALTFGLLLITGFQHDAWGEVHRWTGHGLKIGVWVFVMFALGMVWYRYWPRVIAILGRTGLLIACIGLTLLAGMSGYLGPTNNPGADEETYNRCIVQHYFVFPLLLCLSVGLFSRWELRRGK